MAKQFSSKEARQLIQRHRHLLRDMIPARGMVEQYAREVRQACERVLRREALKLLDTIPIEEINRDKKGIKVKLLRECGYETVGAVYAANLTELADLRGISDEGAALIHETAAEFLEGLCGEAKLRLNADERDADSSALVKALHQYRLSVILAKVCGELLEAYEADIRGAIAELETCENDVLWIFKSRAAKDRLLAAKALLEALDQGEYATRALTATEGLTAVKWLTEGDAWDAFAGDAVSFLSTAEELCPGCLGSDDTVYGLPEELAQEIRGQDASLEGLFCSLRRYQEWGVKYILRQGRVLLGDEMGLGKTVQAIAAMVALRNAGGTHFAVICPASVMINWGREIRKHSDLPVIEVHGFGREQELIDWVEQGGVAITTYETAVHFRLPPEFRFSMAVVDEAHYIKNPAARRTMNTKRLCEHADRLLFMTGTALENNVDEMVELIRILRPELAVQIQGIAYMASAPQFRDKVAPVYYRRKREDVLNELPELIESREWCTMTDAEEAVYEEAVLARHFPNVRRVSWNAPTLADSSKARRLTELVEEARKSQRKVIVFSFFLDTVQRVCELFGDLCTLPITGALSPAARQEIIDEFSRDGKKIVLPAQIQSGGTGLNIQAASVVVICEPQFKPSIESQAISRAYRMGQARNVLVYRLLCEDTVDERITELLEQKQAVFDAFADESVAALENLELDDKGFRGIIDGEVGRILLKREGEPAASKVARPVEEDAPEPDAPSSRVSLTAAEEAPDADAAVDPEYRLEVSLSYSALVEHLRRKYGKAKGDYFTDETCRTVNLINVRAYEGLHCHHVDAIDVIRLSEPEVAAKQPFAYQKADRLVYANVLEHLLLHIKIAEENAARDRSLPERMGVIHAARGLCREMNDYFEDPTSVRVRQSYLLQSLAGQLEQYAFILRYFATVIESGSCYTAMISRRDLARGSTNLLVPAVWERIE